MDNARMIAHDPVAGLVDIPLPAVVSLLPETWPSRLTVIVFLVTCVGAVCWFIRDRKINRYRRVALAELRRIADRRDAGAPAQVIATDLAFLLRRTALDGFPRTEVAPLSGATWLAFLDRTSDVHDFSDGTGRSLAFAPYRPLPGADLPVLFRLTDWWIRRHHV